MKKALRKVRRTGNPNSKDASVHRINLVAPGATEGATVSSVGLRAKLSEVGRVADKALATVLHGEGVHLE